MPAITSLLFVARNRSKRCYSPASLAPRSWAIFEDSNVARTSSPLGRPSHCAPTSIWTLRLRSRTRFCRGGPTRGSWSTLAHAAGGRPMRLASWTAAATRQKALGPRAPRQVVRPRTKADRHDGTQRDRQRQTRDPKPLKGFGGWWLQEVGRQVGLPRR